MRKALLHGKLVIFDCDGVLVDSEHLSNQALVHCLNELDIELSLEEAMERFKGRNLSECFAEIQQSSGRSLPDEFETNFRNRRNNYFESKLRPVEGISRALDAIPYAKCVASNGPFQMITRNLEITGLNQHFENNVFSAYQIQRWKPDPELFLHACKEMKFAPKDCVVVEDSTAGILAARAGGFKVLAFGFHPAHSSYAVSFQNMQELPELIRQVFGAG